MKPGLPIAPPRPPRRNRGAVLAWLTLAAGALAASGQATALKPDERVVFYPVPAWRVPGGWETELRGCAYELESRRLTSPLLRRALGIDDDELSPEQRALYHERSRLFLVDHESGCVVTVKLGGAEHRVGPSAGDGVLTKLVRVSMQDAASAALPGGRLRLVVGSGTGAPVSTAEAHLLPETGLSVVSDIDDTIKISQVRERQELLRNTFCRPFQPVPGMRELYRGWAATNGARFHYVSASPWQLYPVLAGFVASNGFPAGTFHLKNVRLADDSLLKFFGSPEEYKRGVIEPLLDRFPRRRFVLVGDSGERDPEIYAALARRHPNQIAAIFIRDVTGEPAGASRYQAAFAGAPASLWRVFREPAECRLPK